MCRRLVSGFMNRYLCSICALSLLAFSIPVAGNASQSDTRTLRAAYTDFPPLTYTDENGEPAGYFVRFCEQIAANAGYDLQWRELPIGRIYMFLRSGKVDFWAGLGGLPHIQGAVVESTPPIGNLTLAAFHLSQTPSVNEFDDLKGTRLILMSGYTYLGTIDHVLGAEDTTAYTAPHHESAMRMLAMGRGDYLLHYLEPMREVLRKMPLEGLRWSKLMTSRLAFVVSRETAGHGEIMERLEEELTSSGTVRAD